MSPISWSADAVYEALRRAVLEGKVRPGEPLRQELLAEEFGVSQITVRDALSQLISAGLAMRAPYKGVRVIELTLTDLEEAYTLRAQLEGWAAERAATRLTRAALAELRRLLPDTYVTAQPASIERARQANRAFHEIIIEASQHALLAQMIKEVWNRIDPMTYYGRTELTPQGAAIRRQWGQRDRRNHVALIAALAKKDGPRARQLVEAYTLEVWHVLAAALEADTQEKEKHG